MTPCFWYYCVCVVWLFSFRLASSCARVMRRSRRELISARAPPARRRQRNPAPTFHPSRRQCEVARRRRRRGVAALFLICFWLICRHSRPWPAAGKTLRWHLGKWHPISTASSPAHRSSSSSGAVCGSWQKGPARHGYSSPIPAPPTSLSGGSGGSNQPTKQRHLVPHHAKWPRATFSPFIRSHQTPDSSETLRDTHDRHELTYLICVRLFGFRQFDNPR